MSRLLNVAQLAEAHPAFQPPRVRWLLFKSHENGLEASGAVIRLGRRVLIDEPKFLDWVRASAQQAAHK